MAAWYTKNTPVWYKIFKFPFWDSSVYSWDDSNLTWDALATRSQWNQKNSTDWYNKLVQAWKTKNNPSWFTKN